MFTKTKSVKTVKIRFSEIQLSKKQLAQLKGGTDASKDISKDLDIVIIEEDFT